MTLVEFLDMLDTRKIAYRLDRERDAVMVLIATPGKRWEVEFMDGGGVEVESFHSDGTISDERILPALLAELD
jgi:hypothetical protein